MIMRDETHMIGVDNAERSETITNYGKKSDEDIVDYVDEIGLAPTHVDPTDEEQNPSKTEECDKSRVQGNEESESCVSWSILALTLAT
jgi:hypothetical protein